MLAAASLARTNDLGVTVVERVTGDGTFHRVDADTEPELFWAVGMQAAQLRLSPM
jgi:hypothetical protein